jgi:hypothetical protein
MRGRLQVGRGTPIYVYVTDIAGSCDECGTVYMPGETVVRVEGKNDESPMIVHKKCLEDKCGRKWRRVL